MSMKSPEIIILDQWRGFIITKNNLNKTLE